jgi:hypothetical protein
VCPQITDSTPAQLEMHAPQPMQGQVKVRFKYGHGSDLAESDMGDACTSCQIQVWVRVCTWVARKDEGGHSVDLAGGGGSYGDTSVCNDQRQCTQ